MFETKGRKNLEVVVEGKYYMAKKPQSIGGGTIAVLLPKEWVDINSVSEPISYLLLDVRDTEIIIIPWHGKIPLLEGVG